MFSGLFIGLTTIDIQYYTEVFPKSNVKVKTGKPDLLVGGPATNAAVAFSFLKGESYLYSAVGENPLQKFIQNDFAATKIAHTDLAENRAEMPVIASVITSGNGDRTIFTYNPDDIDVDFSAENILTQLKPDFLFVDGFYPRVAIEFAKAAKSNGIPVVFDGGSWKPYLDSLLRYVDIAICSEQFIPPGCCNSSSVFKFLEKIGVKYSVITRGSKSVLFAQNDQVSEIQVEKITAIDTLGAGDFFHGAFCYYLLATENIEKSLIKSAKLATETCKFNGTREWLIKLKKEEFL